MTCSAQWVSLLGYSQLQYEYEQYSYEFYVLRYGTVLYSQLSSWLDQASGCQLMVPVRIYNKVRTLSWQSQLAL